MKRKVVFFGRGTINKNEVVLRDFKFPLAEQGGDTEDRAVLTQLQTGLTQVVRNLQSLVIKNLRLKLERQRAYAEQVTPDCRHGCAGCAANKLLKEVPCDA